MKEHEDEILHYGDEKIATAHAPVPKWLILTYIVLPIWGIIWFLMFWNGSDIAWFDPGHWKQLQRAANTTMPFENVNKLQD